MHCYLAESLGEKDRDPAYYLDIEELMQTTSRRSLIYLVDEAKKVAVQAQVVDSKHRHGVLSWQELGGLQVSLARELELAEPFKSFMAGMIQYQFCQKNIRPTVLGPDQK